MQLKYQKVKTLGEGAYGKAILVRKKADNKKYVVKEINVIKMVPKERREVSQRQTPRPKNPARKIIVVCAALADRPGGVRLRNGWRCRVAPDGIARRDMCCSAGVGGTTLRTAGRSREGRRRRQRRARPCNVWHKQARGAVQHMHAHTHTERLRPSGVDTGQPTVDCQD